MSKRITTDNVAVQVEVSRTDVWVPEGLALEKRNYDPAGIKFDPESGLAFDENVIADRDPHTGNLAAQGKNWVQVVRKENRRARPVAWVNFATEKAYNDDSVGPIITQNSFPISVRPGMEVNWAGQFAIRLPGTDHNMVLNMRAYLYGCGEVVDEYGVTEELTYTLIFHQQIHTLGGSPVNWHLFTLPAMPWVTIPEHVTALYLVIATADTDGEFTAMPLQATQQTWFSKATVDMHYFASPPVDSTTDTPLTVFVRDQANTTPTYAHALSSTGYAFKNRARFDNITPGVEITALPDPAATGPQTIDVHDWDGTRGALLSTIAVPSDAPAVVSLDHTGSIELVCASDFYVESVLAPVIDTEHTEQTRIYRHEYATLTDSVSSIETRIVEADLGVSTVRFVSDSVPVALPAGARARVLARYDGGYAPLVTGSIRGRRLVPGLPGRPTQVEVSIHDDWHRLGAVCPVAYDQPSEYGRMVHSLGTAVSIAGVDYTGPPASLPDGYDYFPSYHATAQTMREALTMTRNTHKWYLFVDRAGRLQFTDTLPDTIALHLSDMPGEGDMSYSSDLEIAVDSTELVTTVQVSEHLLDYEDYIGRTVGAQDPPVRFGPIAAKVQKIDYRRAAALEAYGESKTTQAVIRGTGRWEDLRVGDFGSAFAQWAAEILDEYAHERESLARVTVPVDARDVEHIASLQPFDAVALSLRGTTYIGRVRAVTHAIDAATGRWLCTLDFSARSNRTYWLPPVPAFTPPPIDGGYYNGPGGGLYDGGTPESPGTGLIDGGEI